MLIYFYIVPMFISLILATILTWYKLCKPISDYEYDTRGNVIFRYLYCAVPLLNMCMVIFLTMYVLEYTGVNKWLDEKF